MCVVCNAFLSLFAGLQCIWLPAVSSDTALAATEKQYPGRQQCSSIAQLVVFANGLLRCVRRHGASLSPRPCRIFGRRKIGFLPDFWPSKIGEKIGASSCRVCYYVSVNLARAVRISGTEASALSNQCCSCTWHSEYVRIYTRRRRPYFSFAWIWSLMN